MKLYVYPVAPNPTKVRLYLAEKRAGGAVIPVEEVSVDLRRGEQKGAAHLARNPAGKLPVLELDDGTCITESLPIIEYLEELYPSPGLIGDDPRTRARVRELERIADFGVLLAMGGVIHATRSPLGWPPNPGLETYSRSVLTPALARLDRVLSDGRPFLAGEDVSIADCTLAAALAFGHFGGLAPDPALRHLRGWQSGYLARAPARQVLPPSLTGV